MDAPRDLILHPKISPERRRPGVQVRGGPAHARTAAGERRRRPRPPPRLPGESAPAAGSAAPREPILCAGGSSRRPLAGGRHAAPQPRSPAAGPRRGGALRAGGGGGVETLSPHPRGGAAGRAAVRGGWMSSPGQAGVDTGCAEDRPPGFFFAACSTALRGWPLGSWGVLAPVTSAVYVAPEPRKKDPAGGGGQLP
ncbi:translation initiation factor IF-2-like [Choloepus didactylus]|uniref:translation initiation factor IF-2-like n=1 Tax=Choloepus didactylus TaxID=27675 RepID=UPI00189CFFC7|nr:translation initiation factor IF-2-like [Choloepus didactylus]